MIPVVNVGEWTEVRVYRRKVTWFSWRTGSTQVWSCAFSLMLLTLCLLLPACVGDVWHVDSRFTPEEEQKIQAAADSWTAVGAPEQLLLFGQKVDVRDTGRRVVVRVDTRLMAQVSDAPLDTGKRGRYVRRPDAERIFLNIDTEPQYFQWVAAHEFGHALIGTVDGLTDEDGHLPQPGTLMYWYADAPVPTELDVRTWKAAR